MRYKAKMSATFYTYTTSTALCKKNTKNITSHLYHLTLRNVMFFMVPVLLNQYDNMVFLARIISHFLSIVLSIILTLDEPMYRISTISAEQTAFLCPDNF